MDENFNNSGMFSGNEQDVRDDWSRDFGQGSDQGQSRGYGYQEPSYGNQYMPQGGYERELEEPVSVGEWIVSLLLVAFVPCVGIILAFVWAFSKTEKKSKSNFFKAILIVYGIAFVLMLIVGIFVGVMGTALY